MKNLTCVIVNGYLSGTSFLNEFTQAGIQCIHVSTSDELKIGASKFKTDDYVAQYSFDGNFNNLVEALKKYDPIAVVPGIQSGVELCDRLAAALGLEQNVVALASQRLNKYQMNLRLQETGLACAQFIASESLNDLLSWYREKKFSKVVIKPLESLGSEGVRVCNSEADICKFYDEIIGHKDQLGHNIDLVLLQEYLEGTEYIVNTVSKNGAHIISDVWRYNKEEIEGSIVYEKCELIDSSTAEFSSLIEYAKDVLIEFGVVFGASHCEIMLTNSGPKLVELNPRICGAGISELAQKSLGRGQVQLLSQLMLQQALTNTASDGHYVLHKHAAICPLISRKEGKLLGLAHQEEIKALPAFESASFHVNVGEVLPKTVDLFSQPGLMFLVHEDKAVLEADFAKIRELEATMYLLEV